MKQDSVFVPTDLLEMDIKAAWERVKDIIDDSAACRDFDELDGIAISKIENIIEETLRLKNNLNEAVNRIYKSHGVIR